MCTDYIQSYNDLQQELENAKDTLVVLNDNIKRIIGRGPKLARDTRSNEIKRCDDDKAIKHFQDSSGSKKRANNSKSVFKRLSSPTARYNNSELRPRLTSRVIRELPSRQEIVAAQCADSESRARNRRMFGSLLGTLHKFCQEESRLKQKEEKKAQIEKKLEEQEILEKESIKRERETLFVDRKRKQMEIKRLESKMSRIKDYEIWENSMKGLKTFIKTKTTPCIYYRPKVLTNKTEKLLAESLYDIDAIINKKKEDLKLNLIKLEENLQIPEYDTGEDANMSSDKIDDDFDNSSVTANAIASSICVIKDKKCDPDSKENKIRYTEEPMLSSSVVIINN
ncbi:pinin [Calliphora vicina]|uniref:pinin n=1 Tax=Calliphora vicina TaxID=7373 RepID=UPI00325BB2CC